MFRKDISESGNIASHYATLLCHGSLIREHTRKVYADGFPNLDGARFSKSALQTQVQGRRSARVTKRLGNKNAICVVPARFLAFTSINDFPYV